MQCTCLSLIRAIRSNFSDPEHEACHHTSSIPRWFTYKETAGDSFIIELDSTCDDKLLGFVVCGILPPLASGCRICFFFNFEDGSHAFSNRVFGDLSNWVRDFVYMWFVPLRKIAGKDDDGGRKYDEIGCYYVCESSGQAIPGAKCGVCPIYASQFDCIIQQISESNTCHDDDDDDDDDEKPDEKQVQPHSQTNLNQINPPSLNKQNDKQNERKGDMIEKEANSATVCGLNVLAIVCYRFCLSFINNRTRNE